MERVVRLGMAEMCMRDAGRGGWSGNNAMLLYAMVAYAVRTHPTASQFVVQGSFDDVFFLLSERQRLLRAIWTTGTPPPIDLKDDMFFYERFRGRSGRRINIAKSIADNLKYLMSMTSGEVPFTDNGIAYRLAAELRTVRDGLSLSIDVRGGIDALAPTGAIPTINLPRAPRRLSSATRRDLELHMDVLAAAVQRAAAEESVTLELKLILQKTFGDPELFPEAKRLLPPIRAFADYAVVEKLFARWPKRVVADVIEPGLSAFSPKWRQLYLSQRALDEFALNVAHQIAIQEDVWTRMVLHRNRKYLPPEVTERLGREPFSRLLLPLHTIVVYVPQRYEAETLNRRFEVVAMRILDEARKTLAAYIESFRRMATGGHTAPQMIRIGQRIRILRRMNGWPSPQNPLQLMKMREAAPAPKPAPLPADERLSRSQEVDESASAGMNPSPVHGRDEQKQAALHAKGVHPTKPSRPRSKK